MEKILKLTPRQQIELNADRFAHEWWRCDGAYIDPDTDEVDWYEKRVELAKLAFIAGYRKGAADAK